jgi:hypothetical protein
MSTDNQQRPRAASMFERAVNDAADEQGGRFARNTQVSVAGTGPIPHGSVLVGPEWSQDAVPKEEPLGYEVDALPSMLTVSGFPPEEPQAAATDDEGAPTE